MNKNWLYRVLALALVAMLALPMFALAEDVLPEQVEVAAEEGELTFGEDEAVSKDRLEDSDGSIVVDLAWGTDKDEYSFKVGRRIQIWVESSNTTKVKFKSSNKKVAQVNSEGVMTCIDVGTAKITVSGKIAKRSFKQSFTVKVKDDYRAAKAVILFDGSNRAVTKYVNASADLNGLPSQFRWSRVNDQFTSSVWADAVIAKNTDNDPTKFDTTYTTLPAKANVSYDDLGISGVIASGNTIKVPVGEGWHTYYDTRSRQLISGQLYMDMMAQNKDNIYLDGIDDPTDVDAAPDTSYAYNRDYEWKITSGTDVMFVDNIRTDRKVTNGTYRQQRPVYDYNGNLVTYGDRALHLIFYKPGKASMTVTTASVEGNRTSSNKFKFVVEAPSKTFYKPTNADLKTAIANKCLYYGVQSIAVKDMGTAEVTLFFVNGTDITVNKLEKFKFSLRTGLLPAYAGTDYPNYTTVDTAWLKNPANSQVFVKTIDDRTIKNGIKSHKITTVKLTFKTEYGWYANGANNCYYQRKTTKKNELLEPFQDMDSPRYFYFIDQLQFKLAGMFYNAVSFNPTTGVIPTTTGASDGVFFG